MLVFKGPHLTVIAVNRGADFFFKKITYRSLFSAWAGSLLSAPRSPPSSPCLALVCGAALCGPSGL